MYASGNSSSSASQAGRESFDARFRRGQIGMRGAIAVDLDLQAVQAGVIDVIGQARARAQVIEAPAADDAERDARLRGRCVLSRSHRSGVSSGAAGSGLNSASVPSKSSSRTNAVPAGRPATSA